MPPPVSLGLAIYFALVASAAVLLFAHGFFLTRHQLTDRSSCAHTPPRPAALSHSHSTNDSGSDWLPASPTTGCWSRTKYSHAVILLIDALRFDFIQWNATHESLRHEHSSIAAQSSNDAYTNHLSAIHRSLTQSRTQSLLLSFYADAPTVTLQRLTALTTGSLPTFLDFTNNFGSSAIHSDTVISQLHSSDGDRDYGIQSTFMGDDTWMGLFPNHFTERYPYPSFNVKDLHTVDKGCIRHLAPTLANIITGDIRRSVTIAHFLGVDHVGHRYHASHDTMRDKLSEINAVISDTIAVIDAIADSNAANGVSDNDVVLMVLGDHGMTDDGNHGGSTVKETGTGLFVYSSKPVLPEDIDTVIGPIVDRDVSHSDSDTGTVRQISQIDFVPTLSLLLGLPIPFGSLGSVIPDLFLTANSDSDSDSGGLSELVQALYVNSWQVWNYLMVYENRLTGTFEQQALKELNRTFYTANTHYAAILSNTNGVTGGDGDGDYYRAIRLYRTFLQGAITMCREKWATFNLAEMALGIGLSVVVIAAAVLVKLSHQSAQPITNRSLLAMVTVSAVIGMIGGLAVRVPSVSGGAVTVFVASLVSLLAVIARCAYAVRRSTMRYQPSLPLTSHRPSLLSLSMLTTLLVVLCLLGYMQGLFTNSFILNEANVTFFFAMSLLMAVHFQHGDRLSMIVSMGALKTIQLFGYDVLPSSALSLTFFTTVEIILIVVAIIVIPGYFVYRALTMTVTVARDAAAMIVLMIASPLLSLACLGYWTLQSSVTATSTASIPLLSPLLAMIGLSGWDSWLVRIGLPQLVYAACYAGVPLILMVSGGSSAAHEPAEIDVASSDALPVTNHAGLTHRRQVKASNGSNGTQRLSQAQSTINRTSSSATAPPRTSSAPGVLTIVVLVVYPIVLLLGPKSSVLIALLLLLVHHLPSPSHFTLLHSSFLFFLSLFLFFAFSHSQSLSALQVSAAFVGFDDFHFLLAGLMLAVNTFAHLLLLCLSLLLTNTVRLAWPVWLLFLARAVCTMTNSHVNRRHLMVWEIFAPKFLFDASSFVVMSVLMVVTLGVARRLRVS